METPAHILAPPANVRRSPGCQERRRSLQVDVRRETHGSALTANRVAAVPAGCTPRQGARQNACHEPAPMAVGASDPARPIRLGTRWSPRGNSEPARKRETRDARLVMPGARDTRQNRAPCSVTRPRRFGPGPPQEGPHDPKSQPPTSASLPRRPAHRRLHLRPRAWRALRCRRLPPPACPKSALKTVRRQVEGRNRHRVRRREPQRFPTRPTSRDRYTGFSGDSERKRSGRSENCSPRYLQRIAQEGRNAHSLRAPRCTGTRDLQGRCGSHVPTSPTSRARDGCPRAWSGDS